MEDININCINTESGETCTIPASDPFFTPFFNSGDIMITVLLLIIVIFELIKFLRGSISSVKINRTYLGHYSKEGKEIIDI